MFWLDGKLVTSGSSRYSFIRLLLRTAERCLWIVAVGALGYCAYAYGGAALHQKQEKILFGKALNHELRARETKQASYLGSAADIGPPVLGKMVGILDIPRIGLSSIIDQGADSATLRRSVGHMRGTPLPGESGNVTLAAHRDTYFRNLWKLHPGDPVVIRTLSGTYTYIVQFTHVVPPSDVAVMDPTPTPTLTLITCFPFYYIGNAPKRFVLVATLNSAGVANRISSGPPRRASR